MILTDLPEDIIISILYLCDIQTIILLSSVCTHLRTISLTRSVWIHALSSVRDRHPIACPTHTMLSSCSLPTLIQIGHRTLRVSENWSLPTPRIRGPIKNIKFPFKLDIMFRIPGTHLCLMHSPAKGTMCCWDVMEGLEVSNTVFVAEEVVEASLGRDEPGRYSRALLGWDEGLLPRDDLEMIIVTVFYDDNEVRLEVSFQRPCDLPLQFHYFGIFLYKDIVGVLRTDLTTYDAILEIVAFNITSHAHVIITTDIPAWCTIMKRESQLEIVFTRTNMLLLFEQVERKIFYRCPLSLLPFDKTKLSWYTLRCVEWQGYSWKEEREIISESDYIPEGILASDPGYGVLATSVVSVGSSADPGILVKFWSLDTEQDIEEERRQKDNSTLNSRSTQSTANTSSIINPKDYFPVTETTIYIPGKLQQWSEWFPFKLAHSGRDIVLVVTWNQETYLQLVRLNPETKNTTVHKLGFPCRVDTKCIEGISLDEHLGVVTLVDKTGTLYAVPFA